MFRNCYGIFWGLIRIFFSTYSFSNSFLFKKSDLDRQIKIKHDLKSNFEQDLIFLWTHEMIQGVDYLKSNQIVHCNIKPE